MYVLQKGVLENHIITKWDINTDIITAGICVLTVDSTTDWYINDIKLYENIEHNRFYKDSGPLRAKL